MENSASQKRWLSRHFMTRFGILFLVGCSLLVCGMPLSLSLTPAHKSFGHAVWMHADTFESTAPETLQNLGYFLRLQGIEKVLLLGKNIDGTVPYPSKIALQSTQGDTMQQLVASLKKQQIQVYFYFPVNTDPQWIQVHPEDISYQIGTSEYNDIRPDPEKKLVNLTSRAYAAYISQLCVEAIQQFSLDGIQLDYIRYRNGQYGFSAEEHQRAVKKGVDIEKIQKLTYQTFVKPGDWKSLLQAYDRKDPDVLGWAKVREDIVSELVTSIKKTIPRASVGVTLVSSGATAEAYTAIHFGQKWERLSALIDFATPMAYHGNDPDPAAYVAQICDGALHKIHPDCAISIGLQAHATSSDKLQAVVQTVQEKKLTYVLFRVGTFAFSHMDALPMDSKAIQIQISWFNGCENQSLTALSLENTGSFLQANPSSSTLKWALPHMNKTGETGNLSLHFTTNWNQANQCCLPLLVLHTTSAVVPTLQHTAWSIQHMLYTDATHHCQVNHQTIQPSFLKIQQGQTWIHLDEIPKSLSIQIQKKEETYAAWDQQNGIRIRFLPDEVILQKRIQSAWMEPEILPIRTEPGWVPAKLFLQFFRFQAAYNETLKQVHFVRWMPVLSSSLAISCQTPLIEHSLFLTDDSVWVEWEEYFQTSFYAFTREVHALGRQVVLYVPDEKKHPTQSETDWFMMQTTMKREVIPDDYLFWLHTAENLPVNPLKRTCILPSHESISHLAPSHYFHRRWHSHQAFPASSDLPLYWIRYSDSPFVELKTLSSIYDRKKQVSIVNWQNKSRFEK